MVCHNFRHMSINIDRHPTVDEERYPYPVPPTICCWWDTCPILAGFAVSCVVESRGPRRFEMEGLFCDDSCAMAYGRRHQSERVQRQSEFYQRRLLRALGRDDLARTTRPAKHWSTLTKFGGELEIEQFRNRQYMPDTETHFSSGGVMLAHPLEMNLRGVTTTMTYVEEGDDDESSVRRDRQKRRRDTESVARKTPRPPPHQQLVKTEPGVAPPPPTKRVCGKMLHPVLASRKVREETINQRKVLRLAQSNLAMPDRTSAFSKFMVKTKK